MRKTLDVAYDVVAKEADSAAPKFPELRHVRGRVASENGVEIGQWVGGATRTVPSAARCPILNDPIAEPPGRARRGAHEGVAGPGLAPCGRGFEKERERRLAQFCKHRDGRLGVEQVIAPHGDE